MNPHLLVLFALGVGLSPHPGEAQDSLVFTSLAAGWSHVCGLTKGGGAYCWGWNPAGALGTGDTALSTTPVPVTSGSGGLTFTTLAASLTHTCGVTSSGAAYCWGENDAGQLGAATSQRCSKLENSPCSLTALPVSGGLAFTAIAAGFLHTCALTQAGVAYCWGRAEKRKKEGGRAPPADTLPTVVDGVPLVALSAGGFHTCGLTATGEAHCWGGNSVGQLGRDDTMRGAAPAPVAGGHRFTTLSGGREHTCGVTQEQVVLCWGLNADGQLGAQTDARCNDQGRTWPCSPKPVPVGGDLVASGVSAGGGHTCALTPAGRAFCWGANANGQLGDGTATGGHAARAVATDLTFAALVTGGQHTCGLTAAGTVYCWGANRNGQLGIAMATDSGLPARVAGATPAPSPIPPLRIPGATLADESLQKDTRHYLLTVGAALAGMSCPHASVTDTEVTRKPRNVRVRDGRMVRGQWEERWSVNFCGTSVAFQVQYSADGGGGVTFSARQQ